MNVSKPVFRIITGDAKSGKTYYASTVLKKPLFLDCYGDNSITGNVISINNSNLIGMLEIIKIQLCQLHHDNNQYFNYKTIIIDGFEKFYEHLYDDCEPSLGLSYYMDATEKKLATFKVMEQKIIEWCSTLLVAGYDITFILPKSLSYCLDIGADLSFKRIQNYFKDRIWCEREDIHIFIDNEGKRFIRINGEPKEWN